MSRDLTKNTPLFFTHDDEVLFAQKLSQAIPDARWIDGSRWETPAPPVRESLDQCLSRVVFLWSPSACPDLPSIKAPTGGFRGPSSGVVIQLCRCSLDKDGHLLSGDIGIGFQRGNLAMEHFVKIVWEVLRTLNSATLTSYAPTGAKILESQIKDYVVGPGALEFGLLQPVLKHPSAACLYKALSIQPRVNQR